MTTKSPYREASETETPPALTVSAMETLAQQYLAGFQLKPRDYTPTPWELGGSTMDCVSGAVLCYVLANRLRLEGIEERLARIEQALARIERATSPR